MSSDFHRPVHRREFFRAAARFGSLAAIGVAAYLTSRSRKGQTCINNSICRGCSAFSDCGLPAALSAKTVRAQTRGAKS